jgi:asparagine synthase (glutamine-hydrolysing)
MIGDSRFQLLEPMCQAMAHRGPDDMGVWSDPAERVGLGHRRLSIIDLSPAAHQPMSNETGDVWITYNGEIYDFKPMRLQLMALGHRFRSASDTEVLVHLYEEKGPDFLQELNGIFALGLWDGRKKTLLLARDHAGIKPLYYWHDGHRLFFASEIKSLLRVPDIPHRLNQSVVGRYLTFLWVPGRETMLEGIQKVEPGHYLLYQAGQAQQRQWFRLEYQPDPSVRLSDWVENVHDTLMRTTQRQMVSDVSLGACLSGGTDSSAIVACMRQSFPDRPITCYFARTQPKDIGVEAFQDDYPYAQAVAKRFKVDLRTFFLRPDMIAWLPKMIYHLDEPDADTAVFACYLISKFARDSGTIVLLSGTGGDEVFFGYRSHQAYRFYEQLDHLPRMLTGPLLGAAVGLSSWLLGAQGPVARRLKKFRRGLQAHGLQRHMELVDWSSQQTRSFIYAGGHALNRPEETPECMYRYYDSFMGEGQINCHTHLLIQTFLAAHNFLYTDKTSMAAGVEMRVPYMDVELMRLCARIPEKYKLYKGVTKYPLKRAMERYLPSNILYRGKTGFGAPLRSWMQRDLQGVLQDVLGSRRLRERGLFDPQAVATVLNENTTGRADHAYLLYALLTLELWQQTFIDRPGEQVSL